MLINIEKSQFFKDRIDYLGYEIGKEGIKPSKRGIENLNKFKTPTTLRQVQKIISTINWFRPFIRNLSIKMQPLTELLKRNKKIKWNSECEESLNKIINEIKSRTLLAHPNFNKNFTLHTDASEKGIGAVLSQESQIIGFYSSKLNSSQEKYSTIEKEALAVIKSLAHFKEIIFGSKIVLYTDHSNLTFLSTSKLQRVQRWKLLMDEYNLEIRYIKGKENNVADSLSRTLNLEEKYSYVFPFEKSKLSLEQFKDKEIEEKIKEKKNFCR